MKGSLVRKVSRIFSAKKNMASIAFSKFGQPSAVCSIKEDNGAHASNGIKVTIKAAEVTIEDIRNIMGLSLNRCNTGVAGEVGVGVVAEDSTGNFSTNEGVLVLGQGYGTWKSSGIFPVSSVFKIPNLAPNLAAQLPSALMAYGVLTSNTDLQKNDVILQGTRSSPISSAVAQLGKHMGYKVISASIEQLSSFEELKKIQASGNIKLAATSNEPKYVKALYKALADNGKLIIYSDNIEKLEEIDGLHLSVTSSVFKNVDISGLNLGNWAKSDPSNFQNAINTVAKLIDAKIFTPVPNTQVFGHVNYLKAIATTMEGKQAVLTF